MKKAARLLFLLVSSLLLTGCELPDSLDGLFGWRERFFPDVDPMAIYSRLGGIVGLFIAICIVFALMAILNNLRLKRSVFDGVTLYVVLMVFLGILFLYLRICATIGRLALPEDLSLLRITLAMRWISLSFENFISGAWAFGLTLALPSLVQLAMVIMLVLDLIALALSVFTKSARGIVFTLAQFAGIAMFFVGYSLLVTFIDISWDSLVVAPGDRFVANTAYWVGTMVLFGLCFFAFPTFVAIAWKDEPRGPEPSPENRRSLWSGLDGIIAAPIPVETGPENGQGPYRQHYEPRPGREKVRVREVPLLEKPMKQLPPPRGEEPPPGVNPDDGHQPGQDADIITPAPFSPPTDPESSDGESGSSAEGHLPRMGTGRPKNGQTVDRNPPLSETGMRVDDEGQVKAGSSLPALTTDQPSKASSRVPASDLNNPRSGLSPQSGLHQEDGEDEESEVPLLQQALGRDVTPDEETKPGRVKVDTPSPQREDSLPTPARDESTSSSTTKPGEKSPDPKRLPFEFASLGKKAERPLPRTGGDQ